MNGEPLVELLPPTLESMKTYYREFERDEAIFADRGKFTLFVYEDGFVERYFERIMGDPNRANYLIYAKEKPVGEIALKHIDIEKGIAELSIHLQNDSVKGKGFGTAAERALIEKAGKMGLRTLFADAVIMNTPSRHVLEKVGFSFVRDEAPFAYYALDVRKRWKVNPKITENRCFLADDVL